MKDENHIRDLALEIVELEKILQEDSTRKGVTERMNKLVSKMSFEEEMLVDDYIISHHLLD